MRLTLVLAAAFSAAVATAALAADPAQPQRPTVSVRPAKAQFIAGEPIGLVVTIANPGPQSAHFWLSHPETFIRDLSPIQFDAGRSAPALPPEASIFTGPFLSLTTAVPPRENWKVNIFLQNFLRQPPPGEHRVRYRFAAEYFLGQRPEGDKFDELFQKRLDGDRDNDGPSLTAEGSLTIRITPSDPVALDRILKGYVAQVRRTDPAEVFGSQIGNALDAFKAVDDPAVIPHLAALLRLCNGPEPTSGRFKSMRIYRILERYRDRKDARQVVIDQLATDDNSVVSYALEWLREGLVPIPSEKLVTLLDQAIDRDASPYELLWYLQDVPMPPTPGLREQLMRCLECREKSDVARALVILARWNAPREPAIAKALGTLAGSLKGPRPTGLDSIVNALGAWRYALDVALVRDLLKTQPGTLDPPYDTILEYLGTIRHRDYRALAPQVVDLLTDQTVEVELSALKLLDLWGHALTPKESESLLRQEGVVRDATLDYLKRRRPN